MPHLRVSEWCRWRFLSSGTWRLVNRCTHTNISEAVFIFSVIQEDNGSNPSSTHVHMYQSALRLIAELRNFSTRSQCGSLQGLNFEKDAILEHSFSSFVLIIKKKLLEDAYILRYRQSASRLCQRSCLLYAEYPGNLLHHINLSHMACRRSTTNDGFSCAHTYLRIGNEAWYD